jgi:uncharacterized protein (DUF305 family)
MKNGYKYLALAVIALIIGGGIGYAVHGNNSSADNMAGMAMPTVSGGDVGQIARRASATAHNDQDVMFAQMMISHHQQALAMATLADGRAQSVQVKSLAATIEAAQGPEIATMTNWLQSWGQPATAHSGMAGMNGEMSQSDMDMLSAATGAAFDRLFLQQMTQHHEGAVTMANTQLGSGQYGDALGLAASIVVTQQGQIRQMQELVKQL